MRNPRADHEVEAEFFRGGDGRVEFSGERLIADMCAWHLQTAFSDRGQHLGGIHARRHEATLDFRDAPVLHMIERRDEAVRLCVFTQAPHLESEVVVDAGGCGGAYEDCKQSGERTDEFHFEVGER
jgi:hypothetical protein